MSGECSCSGGSGSACANATVGICISLVGGVDAKQVSMSSIGVSHCPLGGIAFTYTLATLPFWTRRWPGGKAETMGVLVPWWFYECLHKSCVSES